jgi:hypothetical protein
MSKQSLDTLVAFDVVLTNISGTVSIPIKDQIMSLSIFEDISSPLVTCAVVIHDALALSHDMPFIGEEVLDVTIQAPNASKLKYKFFLHSMGDGATLEQNRSSTYTLQGISMEMFTNYSVSVQKGYMAPYDAVVKDMVTSFLKSSKKLVYTGSKGIHQTIIPNLNPLRAIDFVRQKAVSNEYPFSPFFFYETSKGFYFVDIATRFMEAKKGDVAAITKTYRNNQMTDASIDQGEAWGSLISYTVTTNHDSATKLENGAFFNKMQKFDLITKTFSEVNVNMSSLKSQIDKVTDGAFNTSAFIANNSKSGSLNFFALQDSTRPESHIDYLGQKLAYSTLLFQNLVEVTFHADTNLEAGKVLYLNIQKPTGTTGEVETDTKQTGYYMITKLAYHVVIEGEPVMRVACELAKGGNKSIKGRL